jgi:hypothetical protein
MPSACGGSQVDAHGLGRHLVVPDGLEGPAVGGVDEQHNTSDTQRRRTPSGITVESRTTTWPAPFLMEVW